MIVDKNGKEFDLKSGFCLFFSPQFRTISLSSLGDRDLRLYFSGHECADNKRIMRHIKDEGDFAELIILLADFLGLKPKNLDRKNPSCWICELVPAKE